MRKGSIVVREEVGVCCSLCPFLLTRVNKVSKVDDTRDVKDKGKGARKRALTRVTVLHCDLIKDDFWKERPYILSG